MQELVYFYPQDHEKHFSAGHPERPARIEAICQGLQAINLWDGYPHLEPLALPEPVFEAIHTSSYIQKLAASSRAGAWLDMDTYTTPASWDLALQAAGGALAVVDQVWRAEALRGFAITRPPGHHACSDRGMGFCLLNNAALAAEYLIQELGARKVAIVDLDLHHGNGTQEIFFNRDDVFYLSTHQTPLYPGSGMIEEIGAGPGKWATANLPLPPASGDHAFQAAMDEFILPLLERFRPEALLVSVGFDIHWRDPLGSQLLSAMGYYNLIRSLTSFADRYCAGKVSLLLEGGYDLEAGAACAQAWSSALLGVSFVDHLGSAYGDEGLHWVNWIKRAKAYWSLEI